MSNWQVLVDGPARRDLESLPPKYSFAVISLLTLLGNNPRRVGKPLRFDLEGKWSARRGPYRVIYEIDEESNSVIVHKIGHRADIYRKG